MEKTIELFAGIDVAKRKVDVHFHPTGEKAIFEVDSAHGLSGLIELLKKREPKRIVFESTGGYTRRLSEALEGAGIKAHCVPADRIRKFAEAIGLKAKTDSIDSEAIARFAATAKLVEKIAVSAATKQLRDLVVRRQQLVKLGAKEKNHRETMPDSLTASSNSLQDALEKCIAELDGAIVAAVNADDDLRKRAEVLSTIKGCGIATTAALLAFMPELGAISCKRAASLVGVAPFNNESADSDKPRSIEGGRARVRTAIYMGVLTAVVHDDKIRPFYERLLKEKKKPMVALTAAARKLVVIANARMRDALAPKPDANPPSPPQAKRWTPRLEKRTHAKRQRRAG